jgi:hypothetical protein
MATKKTAKKATKPARKNRVNQFDPRKYYDHLVVDEDRKVVAHIRVKPSGLLWSPTKGKGWLGVSMEELAAFMKEKGRKQSK